MESKEIIRNLVIIQELTTMAEDMVIAQEYAGVSRVLALTSERLARLCVAIKAEELGVTP